MSDREAPKSETAKSLRLFDGRRTPFSSIVTKSSVYGEYGVGLSTIWAYQNTKADILSVDSSREWIARIQQYTNPADKRISFEWIDLGEIGNWGRPLTYDKRGNFRRYCEALWSKEAKPDVVLIDGRFRVACFLVSLLNADADTIIIFDDYISRRHYHIVQEFVKPIHGTGNQAVFVVPHKKDEGMIEEYIHKFLYVFD